MKHYKICETQTSQVD